MKHTQLDRELCARILSADLARGCDWRHPQRRPHYRPMPRVRALVAGSVLVLTSLLSSVASAGPLTDAFAAALGRPVAAPVAKTAPKPVQPKIWRCGAPEELWQGSGSARTCEWVTQ